MVGVVAPSACHPLRCTRRFAGCAGFACLTVPIVLNPVLDRLGVPGVALLAPVLGRWMVPAAGVALGGSRRHLLCWAVTGCAVWAFVLTVAFDLLIAAF